MLNLGRFFILILILQIIIFVASSSISDDHFRRRNSTPNDQKTLILIIVPGLADWFFADGISTWKNLRGFRRLKQNGVRSSLVPEFPTLNGPNMLTLMTGQGVDKHKQILNEVDLNQTLFYNDDQRTKSILVTAAEQDIMTSVLPLSLDTLSNISIDENRSQLIVFYTEALYTLALSKGSQSYDVERQIELLSIIVEKLQNMIMNSNSFETCDLVLVSTHGFSQESIQWIYLDDFISMDNIDFVMSYGAFTLIYPALHKTNQVYRELLENVPNVKVYLKEEIPVRLKLKDSKNLAPIFVIAENPFCIFYRNLEKILLPKFSINTQLSSSSSEELVLPQSQSGYDNLDKDMRGVFFARGPCFKRGFSTSHLKMTDVYQVLCLCLGIRCKENDGISSLIHPLLNEKDSHLKAKEGRTSCFVENFANSRKFCSQRIIFVAQLLAFIFICKL